jgi:Uncharacterized protein conserved in bacteria
MHADVRQGQCKLDLVVPGLLESLRDAEASGGQGHEFAALKTLLARANVEAFGTSALEATLFALFGWQGAPHKDLPVAAVTRVVDAGTPEEGWWLRADPVHLRADQDRVLLFDHRVLGIQPEEAEILCTALNSYYEAQAWRFEALHPARWYVRLPRALALRTHALAAVVGCDIHAYLPEGPDGRRWRMILNEIQMLLHANPINTAREEQNEPTINGVWLWGGGALPKTLTAPFTQVLSDEPLALGLARLAGIPSQPLPETAAQWVEWSNSGGEFLARSALAGGTPAGSAPAENHLVVVTAGLGLGSRYDHASTATERLRSLEARWMAPLHSALKRGDLDELCLYPGSGERFRITPASLRRFWRRWRKKLFENLLRLA